MAIGDRFYNRPNKVPYYQRVFFDAEKKHVRQWNVSHRSKFMLYPYYAILFGSAIGSTYMMGRMVLGHKTWFGEN